MYSPITIKNKVLGVGHWMLRNSPLVPFSVITQILSRRQQTLNIPGVGGTTKSTLRYHPHLKPIVSGKMLGCMPHEDFNPWWHFWPLVEIDLDQKLVEKILIQRDDGVCFHQPVVYKHLLNACFHCGVQGHLIRDYPKKHPSKLGQGKPTQRRTLMSPPKSKHRVPRLQTESKTKGTPIDMPC